MPKLSRRQLLVGGVVATGGVAVAAGLGVRSGLRANQRTQLPPRATVHPGIAVVGGPLKDSAPLVQLFFDPNHDQHRDFVARTAKAWRDMVDDGSIQLVHQMHVTDDQGLDLVHQIVCADMVDQYWAAYTGNMPTSDQYRRLVEQQACWNFCINMSYVANRLGGMSGAPVVYRNDELVPDAATSNAQSLRKALLR